MAKADIRLYLDEDVRPMLAEILKMRGYDAVSCMNWAKQAQQTKSRCLRQ